jgi:methionyl-tRNA formyltransferase
VSIRISFFGTPAPAVPSLRAFLNDPEIEVACVVTNPDRPKGRGHKLAAPAVKEVAMAAGVDVWQPDKPREIVDKLRALDLDATAIVAYGSILPTTVLDAGGKGFVNLHFSVLPAWRGAAPVPAAILAGDPVVGVTCFVLDAGMDTGDVLVTETTRPRTGETAGDLTARLAQLGAPALVRAVKGFVDGSLEPVPQDHDVATIAPKVHPDHAAITWSDPAESVDRAVRAYQPVPGAHTLFDGVRLKVHRAQVVEGSGPPGTILRVDRPDADVGGPVVACGEQALRLDEVQPANKPRMSGVAFANGYDVEGVQLGLLQ